MNGFYSVFKPSGKKVADCGSLQDATTLVAMKGDGHYYQFTPFPGDIVDVSSNKQLPTRDIVVNMDGGVGGSWMEVSEEEFDKMFPPLKLKLNQSDAEVFVP
jgi:hypothetical protein